MSQSTYDMIVLGLGGMGSATAFELARRGFRVLGLEQFSLVHDRGSSHGQTRIIRTAYYEDPCYVPLVRRAFDRWYDLEQRTGKHLLTECDCLSIGIPESEIVCGVEAAATTHQLRVERLNSAELMHRYPQFRVTEKYRAVLESEAGFLYVEDCVRAHLDEAIRHGATIHAEEHVLQWEASGNGVTVTTEKGIYHADRLVISAGPWASELLGRCGESLRVMRQTLLWFGTSAPRLFARDRFPIYIMQVPKGHFYGLPAIDSAGHKVARHYGAPELLSPSEVQREPTQEDEVPVREFLDAHLPQVNGLCHRKQTCIYTLSPDRHFILDVHPDHPQVCLAAGFSGHGFKFASVVGEILADLAQHGTTSLPIERFRLRRFLR